MRGEIVELRGDAAVNGQQFARIEGCFGIGMTPEAAAAAAAARSD